MKTQTKFRQEELHVNGNDYTKDSAIPIHSASPKDHPVRKTLIAREGDAFVPLMISKIALFNSNRKTVTAIDFDGHLFTIDSPLSDIEIIVGNCEFFRVNRNVILHFAAIRLFHIVSYGKIIVKLNNPEWLNEEVHISQYMAPKFREWIAGI